MSIQNLIIFFLIIFMAFLLNFVITKSVLCTKFYKILNFLNKLNFCTNLGVNGSRSPAPGFTFVQFLLFCDPLLHAFHPPRPESSHPAWFRTSAPLPRLPSVLLRLEILASMIAWRVSNKNIVLHVQNCLGFSLWI